MADYVISAKITGDAGSFQKAFETAQKSVESFDSRFNGTLGNLKTVGGALTKVGSKLTKCITTPAIGAATALGGLTLAKGWSRLTGIDDARAKLLGLGHTAETVQEIMNSALTSVKGTSYGLDEAATTAAGAVAAGVKPGKELTRYLTLTADAASEAGSTMSEMGSVINKVQTAQVAYTDNLNMLADRGLPIYQWLAKEAGTTAAEVKEMAKDGAISSEMFLNAIEKNIGGAAKIFGENSFNASIKNVGASIGRIGANFLDAGGQGGGFFSTLKPLIGDFTNDLGVLEDKAAELGEKFGQSFQGIVDKVQQARNWFKNLSEEAQNTTLKSAGIGSVIAVGLGPGISALGKGMQSLSKISETTSAFSSLVSSSFKAIPGSFSAVGKGVGSLVGDFKNLGSGLLQPISPLLSKASGLVNGAFGKIGTAIAAPFKKGFSFISDGLGNLVGNIGSKFPKLTGIIASFETNSSGMFSKIGGSISSIMGKAAGFAPVFLKGFNIAAGIGIVFAGLGLLQSGFGDQIDTMLQNVTEKGPLIISNLCYGIANKIPNLINLGGELINNLLNAVIANVPSLLGGGIHIIATLVSSISQQLPKLAPTALSLILKLADSLILNLPKIVTAGLELIMGLVQGLISAVPTLIEAAPTLIAHFVSAIVNMLPKIITTGIILITQLAVGLIQAIPQLISAVPKIINELKSAFSDFDWGSIGRNIIDGIKNGLSSVASNLVQSAKDAGSAALDGIKSMLGIHSPSRVFRDEVGKMMSVGLGIGFVKNLPVKSMVDGVSNAVDRMSASSLSMTANVGTSGLSPVTSHMIEDVSLNYGAAVASSNANSNVIDINSLGDYIVAAVTAQGRQQADALKDGISGMRMTVGGREAGRFISDLGFVRV